MWLSGMMSGGVSGTLTSLNSGQKHFLKGSKEETTLIRGPSPEALKCLDLLGPRQLLHLETLSLAGQKAANHCTHHLCEEAHF